MNQNFKWKSYKHESWTLDHIRPQVPYGQHLIIQAIVDSGGPVVIILASGSEVCAFDPGRGRWIFSERKNPEFDFLRKGSKAVGAVS